MTVATPVPLVIYTTLTDAIHVATIGKWLGKLNLTRLQARPAHPGKDAESEAAFKKTSARSFVKPLPLDTAAKP